MLDLDKYVKEFQTQVSDRAHEVDPNDEEDWFSLTLGWAIGRGLKLEEAHAFASYIYHQTNLG
jgi:hypothetical protein